MAVIFAKAGRTWLERSTAGNPKTTTPPTQNKMKNICPLDDKLTRQMEEKWHKVYNWFYKGYKGQMYQEELICPAPVCYLFLYPVCVVAERILDSIYSRKSLQSIELGFTTPLACMGPWLRFAEVSLFLKTLSHPGPLLHLPSHFSEPPQRSSFSHVTRARTKRGRRMKGEGWTGSQSWKIKPMKQNVQNCWLKKVPGNELVLGVKPAYIKSPQIKQVVKCCD